MEASPLQVRERIVSEAARLFVSRGYDGISMREIAAACGLSKAGIYYHFKDKQDLFLALMRDSLERVGQLVREVRAQGGPRRGQIETFTRCLFERLDTNQRGVIRLANQEMGKFSSDIREDFGKSYVTLFIGPVQEIFAEGMQSGELRGLDPQAATWVLLGMLYPLFAPANEERAETSLQTVELALSIFFDGLSCR